MSLFTSYYSCRDLPEDVVKVCISRTAPKGFVANEVIPLLSPDSRTLWDYKDGRIDKDEYTRQYVGKLDRNKTFVRQVFDGLERKYPGRDVALLCWEAPGEFCHRRLLADWAARNLGVEIPEWGRKERQAVTPDLFSSAGKGIITVEKFDGFWNRADVAKDSGTLYVFTDNTDRDSGRGVIPRDSAYYRKYGDGKNDLHYPNATAAVIRGLPNAFPVSTQRWYHDGAKGETGRWQDSDAEEFRRVVSAEFKDIHDAVYSGRFDRVVFPGNGLFEGQISVITAERVPVLYGILKEEYKAFLTFVDGLGHDAGKSAGPEPGEVTPKPQAKTGSKPVVKAGTTGVVPPWRKL